MPFGVPEKFDIIFWPYVYWEAGDFAYSVRSRNFGASDLTGLEIFEFG